MGYNSSFRIDNFQRTSSYLSCYSSSGCVELANLLIQFGADVNLPATNGMSALTFAAAAGQTELVKLLLNYSPAVSKLL